MLAADLLQTEVQKFIQNHIDADVANLSLKGSPFPTISIQTLAAQIQAKQKAKHKLPTWFQTENILYPPVLNLEQTSSDITAKHKASLVSGDQLIDITGGFGIDSFWFSKQFKSIIHVDLNTDLLTVAQHNFKYLSNSNNCRFIAGNGLTHLQHLKNKPDWIYVDPSRRDAHGGRVFQLEDCQPDVIQHLDFICSQAQKGVLMKTAPLLDIRLGIEALKHQVEKIEVVAVQNEVKELLWFIQANKQHDTFPVTCTNFLTTGEKEVFTADFFQENELDAPTELPQRYLYEPNAAILKAGFFKSICAAMPVKKLAQHSHLYTSEEHITFPGRSFSILKKLPFHKKSLKDEGIKKANITTRNFPISVEEIRKKFSIKDGGNQYIFFTTDKDNQKIVLICEKIA